MTTLQDVKNALLLVKPNRTYHLTAPSDAKGGEYYVWTEISQGKALYAGNRMCGQPFQVSVDLYTKDEYSPTFQKTQRAFSLKGIRFRYNTPQYEEDTGYIHHEWIVEVDSYG